MPNANLCKEKSLVVMTRARQRIHTMPPKPRKQRNQPANLKRVDERRGLALPVRNAADADLGEQQGEDGEDLDGLDGLVPQLADEDDSRREDEDDCALAKGVLGLEDCAGEAGELDGHHLDVDADADAEAVEVGVAIDGALEDLGGVHGSGGLYVLPC